jgi:hypothetical protein
VEDDWGDEIPSSSELEEASTGILDVRMP